MEVKPEQTLIFERFGTVENMSKTLPFSRHARYNGGLLCASA